MAEVLRITTKIDTQDENYLTALATLLLCVSPELRSGDETADDDHVSVAKDVECVLPLAAALAQFAAHRHSSMGRMDTTHFDVQDTPAGARLFPAGQPSGRLVASVVGKWSFC